MLSKLAELLESIPSEQRESPRRLTKLRKIDGINLHERESTDICKDDLLQLQCSADRGCLKSFSFLCIKWWIPASCQ